MDRVIQLLINAAALYVAVLVVDGLDFNFDREGAWLEFILVALIFGLVNTFLKPILRLLTLPITIVTLGLFLLIVNAAMIGLVAMLLSGFQVHGLIPGVLAAIVTGVTSWIGGMILRDDRSRA